MLEGIMKTCDGVLQRMDDIAAGKYKGIEIRAVSFILNNYCSQMQQEEVESMVREFAIESAHSFDEDRQTRFSTFLYSDLIWRIHKYFRGATRYFSIRLMHERVVDGEKDCHVSFKNDLQVKELVDNLTQSSRSIFECLVKEADSRAMQAKNLSPAKLVKITGHSKLECQMFVSEIKDKLEKYV
jgi:hypothetical protein